MLTNPVTRAGLDIDNINELDDIHKSINEDIDSDRQTYINKIVASIKEWREEYADEIRQMQRGDEDIDSNDVYENLSQKIIEIERLNDLNTEEQGEFLRYLIIELVNIYKNNNILNIGQDNAITEFDSRLANKILEYIKMTLVNSNVPKFMELANMLDENEELASSFIERIKNSISRTRQINYHYDINGELVDDILSFDELRSLNINNDLIASIKTKILSICAFVCGNYDEIYSAIENPRFSGDISTLLYTLQTRYTRGVRAENQRFINQIMELNELSNLSSSVKESIKDKINEILNQDRFNSWYCNIIQLLSLSINSLLDTEELRNWYSGGVEPYDITQIGLDWQNAYVDPNQIDLPDNVKLIEFYKINEKMPKYNPQIGEPEEVNYFYLKQYFERFLKDELQGDFDLASIVTKMKQIPIGRVEYVGEAGMDYGGVRVSFFDELMKNFKNSFLANAEKHSYLKEYMDKKTLMDSYVKPEFSEEDEKFLEGVENVSKQLKDIGKRLIEINQEINQEINSKGNNNVSSRKILQTERRKIMMNQMELRQQQVNSNRKMPAHLKKHFEYIDAKNVVNEIRNKLDNFTKVLRNELCLPAGQSDAGPFYVSKGLNEFNTFLKSKTFGDTVSSNYIVAGALLGKTLSCDNGIIGRILENLGEERLIFPGINMSRYLIERLLGNEMRDPMDIFLCKMVDNIDNFKLLVGTPENLEFGIEGTQLFSSYVDYEYDFGELEGPYKDHPEFKDGLNENNILSYLYLLFLNDYEENLLEEYYFFAKGFQQIIKIENNNLCIYNDSGKMCVQGADLKYIIEGDTPYELFETVIFENGTPSENDKYKTMFLEIVREMYNEVQMPDGSIILEATENVFKLLTYWTGGKTFPQSGNYPLKISIRPNLAIGSLIPAHTCFNQLELPKYVDKDGKSAKEIFKQKLYQSMNEGMNFDVAGGGIKRLSKKRNIHKAKKHTKNRRTRQLNKSKKHGKSLRSKRRLKYYN